MPHCCSCDLGLSSNSDSIPGLRTSICYRGGQKEGKKKYLKKILFKKMHLVFVLMLGCL